MEVSWAKEMPFSFNTILITHLFNPLKSITSNKLLFGTSEGTIRIFSNNEVIQCVCCTRSSTLYLVLDTLEVFTWFPFLFGLSFPFYFFFFWWLTIYHLYFSKEEEILETKGSSVCAMVMKESHKGVLRRGSSQERNQLIVGDNIGKVTVFAMANSQGIYRSEFCIL